MYGKQTTYVASLRRDASWQKQGITPRLRRVNKNFANW